MLDLRSLLNPMVNVSGLFHNLLPISMTFAIQKRRKLQLLYKDFAAYPLFVF